jgi:amino acid transporter
MSIHAVAPWERHDRNPEPCRGAAQGAGARPLNGWTLVTTEVARAAASDGLFPRAFAWADRRDTAWFGVPAAALLPSLLMLWSYTAAC